MARLKAAAAAVSLALILSTAASAQTETRRTDIIGVVRDVQSGETLPFANVSVIGTRLGATSNAQGYFVIPDVPGDSCLLSIRYIGFLEKLVEVDMTNPVPRLGVMLHPSTLEMEALTVTGVPTMIAVSKEAGRFSMSPKSISALPALGQTDIFRVLQLLPGINSGSGGSAELYIRGGTPDQNLILFDGMTIYHVDHFFGFFSAFNNDAVKDIQAFTGGFPAEYGGRLSGVIDLTGKAGNRNDTRLGVGVNLLSMNAVIEGPVPFLSDATFLIAARRSYTDFLRSGLYEDIFKAVTGDAAGGRAVRGSRSGSGGGNMISGEAAPTFFFHDINAKLTLDPSRIDRLSFSFYNGKDDLDKSQHFTGASFSVRELEGDVSLSVADFSRWGNTGFSGVWSRRWSERLQTDLSAASTRFFSSFDRSLNTDLIFVPTYDSSSVRRGMATATKEDNTIRDITIRANAEWRISSEHMIKTGIQISGFKAVYTSMLNDSASLLDLAGEGDLHTAFVQDKWTWGELELTLGLRASLFEGTDRLYWEPRASAVWSIADGCSLKGAWGIYRQFVNRIINENVLEGSREFWLTADGDMQPGFAEHRIIGAGWESGGYAVSIEAYEKKLDNLTEYSRRFAAGADYASYFFFGSGHARGIELLLEKRSGNLSGWLGYSLSRVEHTYPKLNAGLPFPAAHDRLHDIKTAVRYSFAGWNLSASWLFSSGTAYTAPESQYQIRLLNGQTLSYIHVGGKNAARLPDFHQLDVGISRLFDWEALTAEFGLSVFNVYNRANVAYREYNLTTAPVTVTDVTRLGFAPSVYVRMQF